jgi:acetyl-CoA C-acetyltransferase
MKEVFIVSAKRTPIGSFGGKLADIAATKLGAHAIQHALAAAGVPAEAVQEVIMGNVCSANLGQAPARQASVFAGLPHEVNATTVNKVCASGMKSVALAAQSIMLGLTEVSVAGGMESMSQIPYYLPKGRYGMRYGHGEIVDGLLKDGLTDVYGQMPMGVCADRTATEFGISREEQDAFAIGSYKKAADATESGKFAAEIAPVSLPQKKGDPIMMMEDEEFRNVIFDKIPSLRPAFSKDGTVTAANASTINDGAAALVLASGDAVKRYNLTPIARVVSFADAEQAPEWFTTAPTKAAPLALHRAGLSMQDVDFFEVNEAFSVVTMAFYKKLDIDPAKVNVFGGAVALGHPLGASGARILVTLQNVLQQHGGRYGLAAICNGGGGASAMVLERM